MKNNINVSLLLSLFISFLSLPFQVGAEVRKTESGLCHTQNSPYYNRIKHFSTYINIDSCKESGGRLTKNNKNQKVIIKYNRKEFGQVWIDADKDCQNSRMETLIRKSLTKVRFKTEKECQVIAGKWISPFSGATVYQASKIDIDHVVPLRWAWSHGGKLWDKETWITFANDPINLLSVEARLNNLLSA